MTPESAITSLKIASERGCGLFLFCSQRHSVWSYCHVLFLCFFPSNSSCSNLHYLYCSSSLALIPLQISHISLVENLSVRLNYYGRSWGQAHNDSKSNRTQSGYWHWNVLYSPTLRASWDRHSSNRYSCLPRRRNLNIRSQRNQEQGKECRKAALTRKNQEKPRNIRAGSPMSGLKRTVLCYTILRSPTLAPLWTG